MKKTIVMLSALAISFGAQAQSLEDGIKMIKYERYTKAKEILTPLAASNALANYYLGIAELGLDNIDAAGADFNKFPNDPANMAGMARVAFEKKNTADGMRLAQAAVAGVKKKDWEPLKYAADAITYTDGGDIQQAITWYKTALSKNDNADLHINLGDAFRKVPGGGGDAMTQWEGVTAKDARNSLAWSRQGSLWYNARNYPSALESYQKAKDADPENPIPYRDLAYAYFYSGKYDQALQNNEEYLKRSDKSCDDRIQHANLLYLTKSYDKAISEMQSVLSTCGERPYMYRVIGYSLYENKDYSGALQNMNLFFKKQDPNKVLISDYMYMGKIYTQLNKQDSADYYLNVAVAKDTAKDKSETYKQIAEDFKAQKNDTAYANAGKWYGKIVANNPNAAPIDYYNWGFYSFYGKNYQEAAKAFEQMETKYPDQPSGTYWRGRVAAAMDPEGKSGAAVPFFLKWLAIPSTDKYAAKPADKIIAYRYLAVNAYINEDKEKRKQYLDELEKLDAADPVLKQIKEAIEKSNAKPAKAPAKAPAKGK